MVKKKITLPSPFFLNKRLFFFFFFFSPKGSTEIPTHDTCDTQRRNGESFELLRDLMLQTMKKKWENKRNKESLPEKKKNKKKTGSPSRYYTTLKDEFFPLHKIECSQLDVLLSPTNPPLNHLLKSMRIQRSGESEQPVCWVVYE